MPIRPNPMPGYKQRVPFTVCRSCPLSALCLTSHDPQALYEQLLTFFVEPGDVQWPRTHAEHRLWERQHCVPYLAAIRVRKGTM